MIINKRWGGGGPSKKTHDRLKINSTTKKQKKLRLCRTHPVSYVAGAIKSNRTTAWKKTDVVFRNNSISQFLRSSFLFACVCVCVRFFFLLNNVAPVEVFFLVRRRLSCIRTLKNTRTSCGRPPRYVSTETKINVVLGSTMISLLLSSPYRTTPGNQPL